MKTKNIDNRLLDFIKKADKKPLREGKGAVIYTRVSSKEQADNNTSLETQKRFCEEYCLKKGYPIKKYFGGTFESAKTDERKEFEKLIAYAKKERTTEAIIVYSYDRFSRSGANAAFLTEELQKAGIRLIAVSQEVDTTTPTGKFQKNIMLMFSQFDNDQRRDKSCTGMSENLRQGYWINSTPFGYTNLQKKEKAKNHKYVINKEGTLLKKGFELKAEGRLTDKEIVQELNCLGCKIHYKSFSRIISNVFYCGYVSNSLIPNEIYKGHHPALISEDLFFKANNITPKNSSKGVSKKYKIAELALKTFAKDEISLSPFTGYIQKGIYYYKTRQTGTCINVSANHLNSLFINELKGFEFVKEHTAKLKEAISIEITKKLKSQIDEQAIIKSQLTEYSKKIEKLELRFIEGGINKELFDKYSNIYETERNDLKDKLDTASVTSSNLEKIVEKGLQLAGSVSELWSLSDFDDKKKLQELVFPDGILYNKEIDRVRTSRTNSIFEAISLLAKDFDKNKNASLSKKRQNSHLVGAARFELATSTSQMWRDNRATLRPDL